MITRQEALPDGWELKLDKKDGGQSYYFHKFQERWSYLHPLAIDMDEHGMYISRLPDVRATLPNPG